MIGLIQWILHDLYQWLDERTGIGALCRGCCDMLVPKRRRGVNLWAGAIVFTAFVDIVTGFFLWMFYCPSTQAAWESVYHVQYNIAGGWLLRGVHYYGGQVLLALVGGYLLHMIFTRAYRVPREFVFWAAVLVGLVVIALLLTGDLLAYTQQGYWSTNVRTSFLLLLPWVGDYFYKIAVGGPEMGHYTIIRFLALHAGTFSAALIGLLAVHHWLLRRSDKAEAANGEPATPYWPDQALRVSIVSLVVAAVLAVLCVRGILKAGMSEQWQGDYLGVALEGPGDPSDAYAAARPDWYFVGVYQFAHIFPGSLKILPIFIIPGMIVALFLVMPILGRWTGGHRFNMAATAAIAVSVVLLSWISIHEDRNSDTHQKSLKSAEEATLRVKELIHDQGIPPTGAIALLLNDPKTQGPKLFTQHCATCHSAESREIVAEKVSAPDLSGFGTLAWIEGLHDPKQIATPKFYGGTNTFKAGKMVRFVRDDLKELRKDVGEDSFKKMLAALAAEAKPGAAQKKVADDVKQLFDDFTCLGCHRFHDKGPIGQAPDLTGYGSREWVSGIVRDPTHERFYGKRNERMPSYAKPDESAERHVLDAKQIEMLTDWLLAP